MFVLRVIWATFLSVCVCVHMWVNEWVCFHVHPMTYDILHKIHYSSKFYSSDLVVYGCVLWHACMNVFVRAKHVTVRVTGGQILQMGPDGSINLWRCGTDSLWAFCKARMQHSPSRSVCVCACVYAWGKTFTTFWLYFFRSAKNDSSHFACETINARSVPLYRCLLGCIN